jgi:hypothetical protein
VWLRRAPKPKHSARSKLERAANAGCAKEDGLSRRIRQPVTSNNGPTFPTTFLPAQSERWTAEVGPVENDVTR